MAFRESGPEQPPSKEEQEKLSRAEQGLEGGARQLQEIKDQQALSPFSGELKAFSKEEISFLQRAETTLDKGAALRQLESYVQSNEEDKAIKEAAAGGRKELSDREISIALGGLDQIAEKYGRIPPIGTLEASEKKALIDAIAARTQLQRRLDAGYGKEKRP